MQNQFGNKADSYDILPHEQQKEVEKPEYETFADWLKNHGPNSENVEVVLSRYIDADVESGFSAATLAYNGNRSEAVHGEAVVGTITLWKINDQGSLLKYTIDDAQHIAEFKGRDIPGILEIFREKYGYINPQDGNKIEKMEQIIEDAKKVMES